MPPRTTFELAFCVGFGAGVEGIVGANSGGFFAFVGVAWPQEIWTTSTVDLLKSLFVAALGNLMLFGMRD